MKYIGIIAVLIVAFISTPHVNAVSCTGLPSIGNKTVSNCTLTIAGITGVDYTTNNELSTQNSAVLHLDAGASITINSGGKLTAGSVVFDGGTIAVASGGSINPGSALYIPDADADGWASSFATIYIATASGRRRLSFMRSMDVPDGNDNQFSIENTSCTHGHCRDIAVSHTGATLTNTDVLIDVDTATPIANNRMTADCGDIRFFDSDDTTSLNYWIEGGCNTASTQIWVRVPSIPDGGKTIFMGYDGVTATDGQQSWSGTFTLLNTASCPAGWTRNADLDARVPYGAVSYGTPGGASTHSHTLSYTSSGASASVQCATGTAVSGTGGHTHTGSATTSLTDHTPPYLTMLYCSNSQLTISSGLIGLFDASAPSGWTRFMSLDGLYPIGGASYGATGGNATTSHTYSGTTSGPSGTVNRDSGTNGGMATTGHTHTYSGSTAASNTEPPYLTMIYGSANSDTQGIAGLVSIVSALPPYGWTQFSSLDSRIPKGSDTYGTQGGSPTHSHTYSGTTSAQSATRSCNDLSTSAVKGHTHTYSGTTTASGNMPPYMTVIFAKRNTPVASTVTGTEY